MKLQSQQTRRFDVKELRALAKRSRPPSPKKKLLAYVLAGYAVGALIVVLYRALEGAW